MRSAHWQVPIKAYILSRKWPGKLNHANAANCLLNSWSCLRYPALWLIVENFPSDTCLVFRNNPRFVFRMQVSYVSSRGNVWFTEAAETFPVKADELLRQFKSWLILPAAAETGTLSFSSQWAPSLRHKSLCVALTPQSVVSNSEHRSKACSQRLARMLDLHFPWKMQMIMKHMAVGK